MTKILSITLLLVLVVVLLSLSVLDSTPNLNFAAPTSSSTVSPIGTITMSSAYENITPERTPQQVNYDDMLDLYKEVLESTKWTFQISLIIISLAGVGAVWWLQKSLNGVWDANARAKELEAEFSSYKVKYKELAENKDILDKKLENTEGKLEKNREDLRNLTLQTKAALNDISRIQYLETITSVHAAAMQLLRGNIKDFEIAKRKLLELSKDDNSIVRRECIRVFSIITEYPDVFNEIKDDEIIARLIHLSNKDDEMGVRIEAKKTLGHLYNSQSNKKEIGLRKKRGGKRRK